MARVFYEDIYNLGLLYAYMDSNGMQKMVLLDDLKKYYNTVEKNLDEMDSDVSENLIYASIWYDNDEPIYFISRNKEDEVYYILKPEFDLERAIGKYISCLPADVLKASLMENALECIEPVKKKEVKNDNQKEKSLRLSSEVTLEK
ncbi:MAG TPA: hypothetical protein DHV70_06385 [Firmicutes bacterium]|nr:hypothetical protein [Bacillota bacterium]